MYFYCCFCDVVVISGAGCAVLVGWRWVNAEVQHSGIFVRVIWLDGDRKHSWKLEKGLVGLSRIVVVGCVIHSCAPAIVSKSVIVLIGVTKRVAVSVGEQSVAWLAVSLTEGLDPPDHVSRHGKFCPLLAFYSSPGV